MKTTLWLLIFVSLLSCSKCFAQESVKKQPNIILIVVDTLRADHLSSFGYHKLTTPNIDTLAKSSTRFDNAVTPINRTIPSATSIFTGLYPHTHGARSHTQEFNNKNAESNLNIAEILQKNGYTTAAFVANTILTIENGMGQGFDAFENMQDDSVTQSAIYWLDQGARANKPVFLVLWYIAPHWPYTPPLLHLYKFTDDKNIHLAELIFRGDDDEKRIFSNIYSEREQELLIAAYDAEIFSVDKQIGDLIEYLNFTKTFDDTLILFTSDHGESLGDHHVNFEHGEYLYNDTVRVPLIVKKPYQKNSILNSKLVSTIDIFPTILNQIQIPNKSEGIDLFANENVDRITFGESGYANWISNPRRYLPGLAGKWRYVRSMEWELIFIPTDKAPIFEFYNIKKDPAETLNLINALPFKERIEEYKKSLFNWIKPEDLEDQREFDEDHLPHQTQQKLKSLGYL